MGPWEAGQEGSRAGRDETPRIPREICRIGGPEATLLQDTTDGADSNCRPGGNHGFEFTSEDPLRTGGFTMKSTGRINNGVLELRGRCGQTAWRAGALVLTVLLCGTVVPSSLTGQADPVIQRIIDLGTEDNRVMVWADYATNRFGGRLIGSDAYTNAAEWAAWQFQEWGAEVEFHHVGEMPVGFNRGPWFGKMVAPEDEDLYFGTPSYTAGTMGLQRGGVVILRADPFSIPGRNPSEEDVEAKRAAVAVAVAEVQADPAFFRGSWVLIGGENTGFARDGRRGTPEYSDSYLMPPLTRALVEAGALGTIQRAGLPLRALDGHVNSWDDLPELPDIKLLDTQYDRIRDLAEAGQVVELEFDIRNWFRMGPVDYSNIIAIIPGTLYPDEYVVMGGHFDSYDGGTGGVDDGSGFSVGMEAFRLIQAAGGAPKRSIVMMLFAAEEMGLVGSQAWLRDHPELHDKIVVMINRDGSPSAITGAVVPPAWEDDFRKIADPLEDLNPRWPFTVEVNPYPGVRPTDPGGTDASSFAQVGIPTLNLRQDTDYPYIRAWHTLYDLYSELVPYTEHQEHSAVATAVLAYGIANLDHPLSRDGVYLPDGLFADIVTDSGARVITSLDYVNAPLQTAQFVRLAEGDGEGGAGGYGGRRTSGIGRITEVDDRGVRVVVDAEDRGAVAAESVPLTRNPEIAHDAPGILGLSGPGEFYLTTASSPELDSRFTALGRVVAGMDSLADMVAGDRIRRIRILRSGEAAAAFATDNEAFRSLLEGAR